MLNQDTRDVGLMQAIEDLEETASLIAQTFIVPRHGLIFERSGDSMAVYDGNRRIDRVTLPAATGQALLEAIDAWELDRYLEVA